VKETGLRNGARRGRGASASITSRLARGIVVVSLGLTLASGAFGRPTAIDAKADDPYALGLKAFEQGRVAEALDYFQEAARLRPRDPRVANALGNAWFALNQPSKAAQEYRRAIQLDPRLAAAHKNLGILEYQQGKFIEAERSLADATRLAPEDSVAWRFLGVTLAAAGRPADAVAPLRRSLQIAPHSANVRLSVARAEADAADTGAARADYRLLMRDASLDASNQVAVGKALLALGDAEDAVVQLSFAREHSPADEDAELALARAQLAAQHPDHAAATLEAALSTAKDKAPLYDLLGWIQQQNHHPTEAAEAYRQAILANPKESQPYLQLSWLYAEHRHFEEAEKTLREGLRFVEDTYAVKVQLGTVLALGGREKEAVTVLEDAVTAQPHNPLGYTTLIIADTMVDASYQSPLRAAEAALRNCPDNYLVHYLYAGLLLREHRPDLSQPGMQKIAARIKSELVESIRLNPDFPHSHYDLARMEYDANRFAAAEREAKTALKADSEFSSARYLLGRTYLKEGRKAEGMTEIARVDREHREEMQRIQTVGQSLLAAQAAEMGPGLPASHNHVTASDEALK
jgi:Flp pilus assembly protein TadD